jgi:hypothetical protein
MDTKAEVQEITAEFAAAIPAYAGKESGAAVASELERLEADAAKPTVPWPTWAITEGHLMAEVWKDV